MEKIKFESKNDFRAYAKNKLSTLRNGYKRNKIMHDKLLKFLKQRDIRSVLIFIPLDIEVDVRGIIATCRRKKCSVYVPLMEGVSFKMVKYRLPLISKKFNIQEPKNSLAVKPKIDFAVVPVIGVDGALKRIGFGKGMYDRFFASLQPKPPIVFVQKEICMTQSFLGEEHDIAADIYLTPYKTIQKRGKNGYRVTCRRRCSRS